MIQFNLLKKRISEVFLQDFPGTNPDISKWKGLDILYFQEHLCKKAKGNVSEKWFYTYFKQPNNKLPRIDMLNLLSEYVGYQSWNHFLSENHIQEYNSFSSENQENEKLITDSESKYLVQTKKNTFNRKIYILSGIGIIGLLFLALYSIRQPKKYIFCFQDSETDLPLKNDLEITITKKDELPKRYLIKNSCFIYYSREDTLKMTVNSKFYKQTTFKYPLNQYKEDEVIQLEPDDYALMLNYYVTSTQKIKDKQKNLRKIIADDALIYQVYDNETYGVEVLNKEQFIGLITLPTTSMKNYILIYSLKNDKNQIIKMKFKIK